MTVLVFELFGRDNSASRVFRSVGDESDNAGRRLNDLGRNADSAARSFNPLKVVLGGVHRALTQNVAALAKTSAMVGGLGATALTVAPYLLRAGQEIWAVAEAAIGASPALLGMAAGAGVALGTLKMGFSGFGDALKEANTPAQLEAVNEALADLHPEARKVAEVVRAMRPEFEALQKNVQGAMFRNLAADVKATGSALITSATPGMLRFSDVVNTTIRGLLKWGSSNDGIKATEQLTNATYIGMARLSPSIIRVVTSFGNMLGRIAEVSMAAGASGLGGVLDWLADRMDRVTAASVSDSLADLRNKYNAVKDAVTKTVEAVQAATRFYDEHRVAIGYVSDALSILAIAFGGPVIAVAAATGMIIRHWEDLKSAKAVLQTAMQTPVATGFMDDMRSASENIVPAIQSAWQSIWDAIGPRLTEIWNKIKNELIPAFGDFIAAISPFVSFLIEVLGPVVAGVFDGILRVISGAISMITGILNVFTALFTGNWSKLWEGVKQILSGSWDVIVGLLQSFLFGRVLGIFGKVVPMFAGVFGNAGRAAIDAISSMGTGVLNGIGNLIARIPGSLGNVLGLLYNAGRAIVQGLINGILSMVAAAGSAIESVVSKIRNMLPFSPAKEGPLSGSGAPDIAGRKIPVMIATGMLGGLSRVLAAAHRIAGVIRTATPRLPPVEVGDRLPPVPRGVLADRTRSALFGSGALASIRSATHSVHRLTPLDSAVLAARAAQAAPVRIEVKSGGSKLDNLLMELLRNAIRSQGGDVQLVLGGRR